jgi:hypothetical protein
MDYLTTVSGSNFYFDEEETNELTIEDISHHLSLVNRFSGATAYPYSVAQHSLNVESILAQRGCSIAVRLIGLLHDAHESFTSDIPTPFTRFYDSNNIVKNAQKRLDAMIWDSLDLTEVASNLSESEQWEIKWADSLACALEASCVNLFPVEPDWIYDFICDAGLITDIDQFDIDTEEKNWRSVKDVFVFRFTRLVKAYNLEQTALEEAANETK